MDVIKVEEINYGIMIMYIKLFHFRFTLNNINIKYYTIFQSKRVLVHGNNYKCMEHDISTRKVFVTRCKNKNDDQKWILENFNVQSTNWTLTNE